MGAAARLRGAAGFAAGFAAGVFRARVCAEADLAVTGLAAEGFPVLASAGLVAAGLVAVFAALVFLEAGRAIVGLAAVLAAVGLR
ncbi:MAG: hypothetical protein ABJL55_12990 [Roseibium sp.]